MKLTIDIPDAVAGRVIDGFCKKRGYVDDGILTKDQFVVDGLTKILEQDVMEIEVQEARDQAVVDAENLITKNK